jgi:hypothetical protein
MNTVELRNFLGINNRLPRYGLGTEEGRFLSDAVNVDVKEDGSLKRRMAARLMTPLPGAHSGIVWAGKVYICQNNGLFRINLVTGEKVLLCPVAGRVSYAGLSDRLYFTDRIRIRAIQDDTIIPVTVATPEAPIGAPPSGNNRYLVALTAFSGDLESAPSPIVAVGAGDLVLPSMPPDATAYGVYVSANEGSIPNLLCRVTDTAPVTIHEGEQGHGRALRNAGRSETPAGDMLGITNSRLFVARDHVLFWSQPYEFGIYDPLADYALFPAPIDVLEPCNGGLWVIADKTYFFSAPGSPEGELIERLPYGAVRFASATSATDEGVYWLSTRGIVYGSPDGQANNLTEGRYLARFAGQGAVWAGQTRIVGCAK